MLLAYLDETYTKEQFWVIALVVSATDAKNLENALNGIVSTVHEVFPDISASAELHGYPLDSGTGGWEPLKEKHHARADIFKDTINVLCGAERLYLFRGCVNLKRVVWSGRNDPHDWALKFVFEKIDREFKGKELVIAICDDVGQREKYREAFSHFKTHGTGGDQPRKLEAFVDALHFVPSQHSRLVQAADIAAYTFRRAVMCPPKNEKARRFYQAMWDQLSAKAIHRFRVWP